MKFCTNFSKKSKITNKVDELNIPYQKNLLDFIQEHQNQRINITIDPTDIINFKECVDMVKQNNLENIYLRCSKIDKDAIDFMQNNNIKYFFSIPTDNWETFLNFIELKVTDIYIIEELCFDLIRVSTIAHNNGVNLRTFPNVSQYKWENLPALKSFFIRPNELDAYEPYFDTLELLGDTEKIDIIYEIYSKDRKWMGKLKEIIAGFQSDIDNKHIIPQYTKRRIDCQRNCLKGGKCSMCDTVESLAKTLAETPIIVKGD